MAEPEAVRLEFAFEARVTCDPPHVVGTSKYGQRLVIPITGGTVAGPRIQAEVLPGGADWQLMRPDGLLELDARYTLKAEGDALISVRNRGLGQMVEGGLQMRTSPTFEAPTGGPYEWLNQAIFVATARVGSMSPLTVVVTGFRIL